MLLAELTPIVAEPRREARAETAARPRIALVIPAHNESARLPETLGRIAAWVASTGFALETIVVDDGSDDGTGTVAESFVRRLPGLRVVRHPEPRGKGAALRSGFAAAAAPVVAFGDANLSAPIEDLPRLLAAVVEGADVAAGSLRAGGRPRTEGRSALLDAAASIFARVAAGILPTGLRDAQCGFKAFRSETVKRVLRYAHDDGFACDVEWLAIARRLGCRLVEVPVARRNDKRSNMKLGSAACSMIADLFRARRRFRTGSVPAAPIA